VALTIGIVGLPNVGKSTLFNALTKNDVLAANYPFATIEPNVGVVSLPDDRLAQLADVFHSERILPATVSFVDIAGIVRGASEGEGLGNQFLANIREADAIAQVVRGFTDDDVVHVEGDVNPQNDLETINAELQLADLQTLEKAIPRIEKEVKGKKSDPAVLEAALAAKDALERGILLSHSGLDLAPIRELGLLTAKPYIYVFNVDEAVLTDAAAKDALEALVAPAHAVFLDAKIESELIDLDPEDAAELLASTGQEESGLNQLARIGFDTLGLQTYLTAGPNDPHRLREGLHQGRGHLVRRPDGDGLGRRGAREGQGPAGGQGLRDAGRRRRRVPLQRLTGAHTQRAMRERTHVG
jgi:GTP-binding protein YchF